jgi:hypothetical protein
MGKETEILWCHVVLNENGAQGYLPRTAFSKQLSVKSTRFSLFLK